MVHLSTIGPLAIHLGSNRLGARSVRTAASLLYLVVERGKEIPRRTLIDLFFADSPESDAAHGVRQLVYRLRQAGVPVDGDMASVMLPRDAATWDVERVESGEPCTDDELLALTSGYLSDLAREVSGPFAEWLDSHRSTVTTTLRRSLLAQLRDEKAKHHFAAVDRIARACLAIDPLNEEATLATAEALVMSGSKVQALSVLDRYIDEVGPRSRDLRFAPKLLRERISEYVAEPGHRGEPPLVGRDSEMATLRALLARLQGGNAEACVLCGSSGIGKSRLMNEACSIAALEGLSVVRCGLQPHDQRRPLAVLRDVAPRLLDLPGSIGCDPDSLALIRGLCGRGEMPARELPRTAEDSEIALARVLASATDLLDAVCAERPVLLCIEDAHWLDPASLDLVAEAVAGRRPLCVLMASQRPLQLPAGLVNAARFSSIEVPRLSKESSQGLMDRLFEQSSRRPDAEFSEWAIRLADGVPFYVQSLFVEYLLTGNRSAMPPTLTASLASKLHRLGDPTRSVFDAVVVLGKHATLARLEAVVQLPRHSLATSLRSLDESGLVRSTNDAVACAHDLFGLTAKEQMPAPVWKLLHHATAELLEAENQSEAVKPWDVAVHWQEAGDHVRGLAVIRRCAEEAIRVGRPQEAIAVLSHAANHALARGDRRQIIEMQLAAFEASGEDSNVLAAVAELVGHLREEEVALRQRLNLLRIQAEFRCGAINARHEGEIRQFMARAGDEDDAFFSSVTMNLEIAENACDSQLALESLAAVERRGYGTAAAQLIYVMYHHHFGDLDIAAESADKLQSSVAQTPDSKIRHRVEIISAEALFRAGNLDLALACYHRGYATATAIGFLRGQIAAATNLSTFYWCTNDLARCEEWFQKTADIIDRSGAQSYLPGHYSNGIVRALDAGRPEEALDLLTEVRRRAPMVDEGCRGHLALAYEMRIGDALRRRPTEEQAETLLEGYLVSRGYQEKDFIVDTLFAALTQLGRSVEAVQIRSEYLERWRRERYPVPIRLTNLHCPIPN